MGIADRHYIRDQPGYGSSRGTGGLIAHMRMFSVNTWLILACVAVFVVDGFLTPRPVAFRVFLPTEMPVPMSQVVPDFDHATRDLNLVIPYVREEERSSLVPGYHYVPLRAGQNGPVIGWHEYAVMQPLQSWLHFSTAKLFYHIEFWRLIGFQFLHANPYHLLANMIGLFFFGPIVERHIGSKRYLAFYLLCGIFGALLYTVLNLGGIVASLYFGQEIRIPGLLFNNMWTPLVGASAGVFGVLMGGAYLAPNVTVLALFIIPLKLRTFAYALVGLALFSLISDRPNAGGEAGHLGGAIAGFYFIRNLHHLHGFFDIVGRVDPTSHHYRKRPGRTRPSANAQAEIDRILAKISREGLHSLTDRERQFLSEQSQQG